MDYLQTAKIHCAFCGERIEVLLDCSIERQEYVEDCQVCCRPLVLTVQVNFEGVAEVSVRFEDE
jgi:hypothetical protein